MNDSVEFLLGKISGQLDGMEQRLDELKDASVGMGTRQAATEARVGALESENARRSGVFATVATLASLLGGGIVAVIGKKLGG